MSFAFRDEHVVAAQVRGHIADLKATPNSRYSVVHVVTSCAIRTTTRSSDTRESIQLSGWFAAGQPDEALLIDTSRDDDAG